MNPEIAKLYFEKFGEKLPVYGLTFEEQLKLLKEAQKAIDGKRGKITEEEFYGVLPKGVQL